MRDWVVAIAWHQRRRNDESVFAVEFRPPAGAAWSARLPSLHVHEILVECVCSVMLFSSRKAQSIS